MSKITTRQIAKIVDELLVTGKMSKDMVSKTVASYLVTEKRTKDLDAVMREIIDIRSKRGTIEATVRSAYAIDETVKNTLQQIIQKEYPDAQNLILDEVIDKSVVGGVRVDSSELRLDASVHGKLSHLTQLTTKA